MSASGNVTSVSSCEQAYRDKPWVVRSIWLDFTASWLSACSRTFKGDLEMMLVLVVLARAQLDDESQRGQGRAGPGKSVSASRIAEITGVPRETVRRKLDAMSARRWVEKDHNREWRLSSQPGVPQVAQDLADLEDASMRHIADFVSRFMAFLAAEARRRPQP